LWRGVIFTMTQAGEIVSGQFAVGNALLDGQLTAGTVSFPAFVTAIDVAGTVTITSTAATPPAESFETTWTVTSNSLGRFGGTTRWVRRGTGGQIGGAVFEGVLVDPVLRVP
jgi:hypothetical protein